MRPDAAAPAHVGPAARDNGKRVRAGNGVLAEVGNLARVVEALDKQRESLERDIHDGVQQRLVSVRIQLELAAHLPTGDDRLPGALADIGHSLEDAIDELREVAHGIHPQVLTDHGLVAALNHVARATAAPVAVAVAGTGLGRNPPELELAIYYCCREAIQNASKHGGTSVRISISLHQNAHSVGFEVSDDGPGFDVASVASGGGLQHMRDRIALLGGRLSIDSRPGVGTVVAGVIHPVSGAARVPREAKTA
jgi:signal transduction histidine kinase